MGKILQLFIFIQNNFIDFWACPYKASVAVQSSHIIKLPLEKN